MATGFRFRKWNDAGNAVLGDDAGAIHVVLDDLLTGGSNPWSKTVNGTNDVTYQAPGGSQIKLHVAQNYALTSNFYIQVYGQVGADPVFPTATQVANVNQGAVTLKCRDSTSTATAYDQLWYGIRTDRFMLLAVGPNTQPSDSGSVIAAGDFPVISGADPGLTALLGQTTSTLSATNVNTELSLSNALYPPTSSSAEIGEYGYAYQDLAQVILSAPCFTWETLPNNASACLLAHYGGDVPLGKIILGTGSATTNTSIATNDVAWRGYIPYMRSCPVREADFNNGDTFTDGAGATYMYWKAGVDPCVFMISDDEPLP